MYHWNFSQENIDRFIIRAIAYDADGGSRENKNQ
jgi:hypothetical protein